MTKKARDEGYMKLKAKGAENMKKKAKEENLKVEPPPEEIICPYCRRVLKGTAEKQIITGEDILITLRKEGKQI